MDVLDDLLMDDVIIEQAQMRYTLATKSTVMEGTFQRKHNGKNTFLPDDGGEPVLVAERNAMHAMDGDRVRIQMMARRRGHVREAQVTAILHHADKDFVGKLSISRDFAFLLTEDRTLSNDIFIPKNQLHGAKNGDKVIVKIIEWPEGSKNPIGRVTEVLGQAGENETEMHAILAEFGLPYTYPKAVEDAANRIDATITAADYAERQDAFIKAYREAIPAEKRATTCVDCGECLAKCPQQIRIPNQMSRIVELTRKKRPTLSHARPQ
jgi:ribonuclease R